MKFVPFAKRALVASSAVAIGLGLASCATQSEVRLSAFSVPHTTKAVSIDKASLLHPKHKYYGVYVAGAPDNILDVTGTTSQYKKSPAAETGKTPNLVLWYQSWGPFANPDTVGKTNFDVKGAQNACAAGVLPMWTWESWDTSVHDPKQGVAYAQPAYSPQKITSGKYDNYIRATAQAIKALNCPIAIRFDQEMNGAWYPWGARTPGMAGSPAAKSAAYIKMWRHVWTIFHNQHVTNALWVWSPNRIAGGSVALHPTLHMLWPGPKYVDWIGIDGYYYNNGTRTFSILFKGTIQQLEPYADNKPWILAETGVGSSPGVITASQKATETTNLVTQVAKRKQFNGLVYFDEDPTGKNKDTMLAYWRFDQYPQSLSAFTKHIRSSAYGSAKPGSL